MRLYGLRPSNELPNEMAHLDPIEERPAIKVGITQI